MVDLEIDGKKVSVPEGSMVMHAAEELGIFVPHFCYHKKLSIAANCRMCLVEVEKAPKAVPACATPVTNGMKVYTASDRAIAAQKSVMEFLLINHPLDCPICDQGGECQLQDLAVGYGSSSSRYHEEKRVVFHKNLGPLVAAEEMTRCIQCTRCVRFGQEVAGVMELGMQGRGEHAEIMSFLGRSVDSELSGNMIDICPVGALTSRPFRYSARTWELRRRRSIAPHDSLGSNLVIQCKQDRVMRALPFENEAVNECWLSDKDRFSYEAVNSRERLLAPMVKQNGQWIEASWDAALDYAAHAISDVRRNHGPEAIGAWLSPHSTTEELWLASNLVRGLGSENVDFRLRQSDFSGFEAPTDEPRAPWLGMPIADISELDAVLFVGSFLRKDHPLIAARVRRAAGSGMQVASLHSVAEDWKLPVQASVVVPPDRWLAELRKAIDEDSPLRQVLGESDSSGDDSAEGRHIAILLGNAAVQHPQYQALLAAARELAARVGARVGVIGEAASSVGGHVVGARPRKGGLDIAAMLRSPVKAALLLQVEPSLDLATPPTAVKALRAADTVVALTAFQSQELLDLADCLLPVAPFTETGGSYINTAGTLQVFQGVARPQGQARPAWKVLRVMGNRLDLPGFEQEDVEALRREALGDRPLAERLQDGGWAAAEGDGGDDSGAHDAHKQPAGAASEQAETPQHDGRLERIADVPIHFTDMLVRRAESLQQTFDARQPTLRVNSATIERLGLQHGGRAKVRGVDAADGVDVAGGADGESQAVVLTVERDDTVADGVARVASAHPSTAALPSMFGTLVVEAER